MTTFARWWRFNLVGVLGVVVQLASLTLLHRVLRMQYLFATAVAIELTLLHNFAWHWRVTWRDRRERTLWPAALLRFHLSNGAISMGGNLILMRFFVQSAHLPVVAANALAIVCCSLVNFAASHYWAFGEGRCTFHVVRST